MNLQELSAAINMLEAFCGPRGKNFLAHVEIPAEVQAAFAQLQTVYGTDTRAANPAYAAK